MAYLENHVSDSQYEDQSYSMKEHETATAHQAWDERWSDESIRAEWQDPDPYVKNIATLTREKGAIKALDLGCGVGRHALFLASIGFQVSAIDASNAGVEHTRKCAEAAGFDMDFHVAPMTELPYENEAFDYLLSWNVIYHGDATVVGKTISEIHRVLKSGGVYQGSMLSKRHNHFGQDIEVAPNTWSHDVGDPEKAHPHFYTNASEVIALFGGFEIFSLYDVEQDEPEDWHWYLHVERLSLP